MELVEYFVLPLIGAAFAFLLVSLDRRRAPAAVVLERQRSANIEGSARLLVQKLAREAAAVAALDAAYRCGAGPILVQKARERVDAAVALRHGAVVTLRETLGLPDHPSVAEISGWGRDLP